MATTPGHDEKQVCYAEQHAIHASKTEVVHSDAPVAVSGPMPWQQQQQHSPPPPTAAVAGHSPDQYSSYPATVPGVYPPSVAPSAGWHSASPPPPSASYATHGAFAPPPPQGPPMPPHHEMAPRGDGGKDGMRILGLRPATFFLSVALAIAIVIAAVGGGVGGSIAVENARRAAAASAVSQNDTSPATSTVTATATVTVRATDTSQAQATATPARPGSAKVPVPPTQGVIDFDCSSVAPTLDISLGARRFSFESMCGQDLVGPGVDILGIIVYNPAHCAQACASYNRNLGRNDCVAVSFQANLAVLSNFGNCFLKNSTATAEKKTNTQISYKLKVDS